MNAARSVALLPPTVPAVLVVHSVALTGRLPLEKSPSPSHCERSIFLPLLPVPVAQVQIFHSEAKNIATRLGGYIFWRRRRDLNCNGGIFIVFKSYLFVSKNHRKQGIFVFFVSFVSKLFIGLRVKIRVKKGKHKGQEAAPKQGYFIPQKILFTHYGTIRDTAHFL